VLFGNLRPDRRKSLPGKRKCHSEQTHYCEQPFTFGDFVESSVSLGESRHRPKIGVFVGSQPNSLDRPALSRVQSTLI